MSTELHNMAEAHTLITMHACVIEAVLDDKKLMAQNFNAHFFSIADRLRSTLPQVPLDPLCYSIHH